MNSLLIYFALPIATVILSADLEKILGNITLTVLTIFAIYLVISFSLFDTSFLVYTILYTLIAYLAAYITEIFLKKKVYLNSISNLKLDKNSEYNYQQEEKNMCNSLLENRNIKSYYKRF